MKTTKCDYCGKKIENVPDLDAEVDYGYPSSENGVYKFSVTVGVHICTGMDICIDCAKKAVQAALTDKETRDEIVGFIIDPPIPHV